MNERYNLHSKRCVIYRINEKMLNYAYIIVKVQQLDTFQINSKLCQEYMMNFRNHTRSCIHTDPNVLTHLRAMPHSIDMT
jgi:hypothetical protein